MREHAEGPRKTTGSTGRVRKAREGLSRPVLIGRAACPLRPPPCRRRGAAGGEDMKLYCATRRPGAPLRPFCALPLLLLFFRFRCRFLWPVALAGLSHPFPSRTRTLRAPAAMVLRPGAWESSAPPVFFSKAPCLVQDEAGGLFLFRAGRRPRVSMPRVSCLVCLLENMRACSILLFPFWARDRVFAIWSIVKCHQ